MAETISSKVSPIRELDEAAALDWLRSQPGGRTKLSNAELGRRWGWPRQRTGRYLKAWKKAGLLKKRGDTIAMVDGASVTLVPSDAPGTAAVPVPSSVPPHVLPAVPLPPTGTAHVTPPETPAEPGVDVTTLATALALATVSAGFSIYGMTSIFVGAFLPVMAMGAVLEAGKLRAVALLGMGRGSRRLRAALVAMVAVLMGFNAVGAYGYLAKAHIEHAVAGDIAVSGRADAIDAKISVQADKVADLNKQITALDAVKIVEAPTTGTPRTAAAINAQAAALAAAAKLRTEDEERRQAKRNGLTTKLDAEGKVLTDLKVERANIDGERKKVEADLGPVRYLATLLGANDQDVLRWFILVVALLLDPAVVLLLLAASAPR